MNKIDNWKLIIGNWRPSKPAQEGMIVPTMVIIMIILTTSALALATFSINHHSRLNQNIFTANALLTAEAGAEQTLYELNQDSNFTGFASEVEFINNSTQGRSTYQTEVVDGSISNEKLVTSTGRIYRRPSDTNPILIRKIRLTVVGTTSSGYSVQTGPGGLIMSNAATIANGEVHINGYLDMSNSARIGSATNPLKVYVAHYNCPSGGGPSYPEQCTTDQPISITNEAHIYGEVRATNQTDGSGMSNPGLIAGSSAEPVALPEHDRQFQVDAISSTQTGTQASCSGNQTRSYPANLHITGSVQISNNCKVTVTGDVWIDGTFEIQNSASIKVADGVTAPPSIMVDGDIIELKNNAGVIANSTDIGFEFVNYYSKASCSPDCTDVTGQDLYNSRDQETIRISNGSLAAGSIFYARWTKVRLTNSGSVGAVIGQTVHLSNTGNISFGTQLSSGQSIWTIKNYRQLFD